MSEQKVKIYQLRKDPAGLPKIAYKDEFGDKKYFRPQFTNGVKWREPDATKKNRPGTYTAHEEWEQKVIENSVYFKKGMILLFAEIDADSSSLDEEIMVAKAAQISKNKPVKNEAGKAPSDDYTVIDDIDSLPAASSELVRLYGEKHDFKYADVNGKTKLLAKCEQLKVRFPEVFEEHKV